MKNFSGARRTAQWVKALAIKPDDLSSSLGTHMAESKLTP